MDPTTIQPEAMALGCLEQPPGSSFFPKFSGALIPRDKWQTTTAMLPFVPRGICQFNLPACCMVTNVKQYLTMRAFKIGNASNHPRLSFAAMHQEITGGRMNQGARPADTMRLAVQRGMVPVAPDAPEFFTAPRQFSGVGRDLHRPSEYEDITTADELVSAIMNMEAPNVCMDWCERDANPGKTGELVMNAGRFLGGHSILACGLLMGYRNSPSGVGVFINNHHGDEKSSGGRNEFGMISGVWGDDGFGIVPIERLIAGAAKYSMTTLRTVQILNQDLVV